MGGLRDPRIDSSVTPGNSPSFQYRFFGAGEDTSCLAGENCFFVSGEECLFGAGEYGFFGAPAGPLGLERGAAGKRGEALDELTGFRTEGVEEKKDRELEAAAMDSDDEEASELC